MSTPAIDPRIEIGIVAQTLRVAGEDLVCHVGDRFLRAHLEGDRFVFTGGYWGEHSLAADAAITSPKRLIAHWQGYCENNARFLLQTGGAL
jgi:hypothetical protein